MSCDCSLEERARTASSARWRSSTAGGQPSSRRQGSQLAISSMQTFKLENFRVVETRRDVTTFSLETLRVANHFSCEMVSRSTLSKVPCGMWKSNLFSVHKPETAMACNGNR